MNYFQLLQSLYKVYDDLENKSVSSKQIMHRIKKAVPFRECVFFSIETLSLPTGKFNVSGLYDPDQDEQGRPPITIEIAFSKKRKFIFNDSNLRRDHWAELCIDLASTLGHEFVHLQQFRNRDYRWTRPYKSKNTDVKYKEIEEYYGDADEIGAYAFMAATELIINSSSGSLTTLQNTNVYKTYTQFFKETDPVMLKLSKLVKIYNKRLEKQYYATHFE